MTESIINKGYQIIPWVYCPLCKKSHDLKTVKILEKLEDKSVIFLCPKCDLDCHSHVSLRCKYN